MNDILNPLLEELHAGRSAILAVVTGTWGSAPRQAGSLMLVRADGSFEGSVSGGCVEGSVIAEAGTLLHKGSSKRLNFSVSNDDAFAVGLACGGTIAVSLFAIRPENAKQIASTANAIQARCSGCLELFYKTGSTQFLSTSCRNLVDEEGSLRLPVRPRPRLDILGAVHIAQALAPMATLCGFDVTVIDPRQAFTEARRFDGASVVNDWPDEYFNRKMPDQATAVVTMTHDPKLDDAGLIPALNSPAFYIGCLGSKKTHASRLTRLRETGIKADSLARIYGPVGLDIGSKSPAEIAVSILSQVIHVRRSKVYPDAI
ncbi:XdhC family protein [Kordiimonas aestuarii]|uniref:XdhC family protein n=1 Tax=Kordiimonas aestuarii TaxID=1005925 RepID=UPI0021D2D3A2|nr:XdhC family protein [Kordiimonas aestuarii]